MAKTTPWNKIKKEKDVEVGISLKTNFGEGNKTIADWLVSKKLVGSPTVYVKLDRGFVGTVADWLENNRYVGNVKVPTLLQWGLEKAKNVVEWLTNNKLIGKLSVKTFLKWGLKKAKTVVEWLRNNKLIGGFCALGKSIGAGFIRFGVKLGKKFADGATTVAQWLGLKSQWGGTPSKDVGLTKNFTHNGNSYDTVGEWVSSFSGSPVSVLFKPAFKWGASLVYTVDSWLKKIFGGSKYETTVYLRGETRPKAEGGIYKNGRWSKITNYASGGYPRGSQLFVAREAGAELVGTIGGHTAVMNNDQIVASVSSGVARAMAGVMQNVRIKMTTPVLSNVSRPSYVPQQTDNTDTQQMIALLQTLIGVVQSLDLDVSLDGEKIKNNTVRRINRNTMSTGRLELIV